LKKIFVDTNIIIDLIADRQPFSRYTIEIFSAAEQKTIKLYTTSHTIATAYYLLKMYVGEKKLRQILNSLLDYITIIPIDIEVLKKSLKSKHKDFEDAIQIYSAYKIEKMDCVVTRNIKDFSLCDIPVFTPQELVDQF
jgi:predicted nucleic acid-binding protein